MDDIDKKLSEELQRAANYVPDILEILADSPLPKNLDSVLGIMMSGITLLKQNGVRDVVIVALCQAICQGMEIMVIDPKNIS